MSSTEDHGHRNRLAIFVIQALSTMSSRSGAVEMIFRFKGENSVGASLGRVDILLLDPKYYDENTAKISLTLGNFKTD